MSHIETKIICHVDPRSPWGNYNHLPQKHYTTAWYLIGHREIYDGAVEEQVA